nr:transcription factor MYB44-like [Tanacetum cinerariifolium]
MPGRSHASCRFRWPFLQSVHRPFTPEEDETILQRLLSDCTGDEIKNRWKSSSMTNEDTTIGAHNENLSHEVGDVSGHQAPSISDMARDNMSSEGTHSYSHDGSAPTWNALYERDSSVITDDDWK